MVFSRPNLMGRETHKANGCDIKQNEVGDQRREHLRLRGLWAKLLLEGFFNLMTGVLAIKYLPEDRPSKSIV